MINVHVCVGSSCYIRGAPDVIKHLEKLIDKYGLEKEVELKGSFCMDRCTQGVTLRIEEHYFTGVSCESAANLFREHVLREIKESQGE